MSETKADLRRQFRAARDALDPAVHADFSRRICRLAAGSEPVANARCVALYAPLGSEVDVTPLLATLIGSGRVVALPRMRPDQRLDFVGVTSMAQLVVRRFGVREPDGPALDAARLDLVIVPGLAFDCRGGRLGWGAGYYDRTLLGYTGLVMGAAFAMQLHPALPMAQHDRPVDGLVCELGFRSRETAFCAGQTRGPVAP